MAHRSRAPLVCANADIDMWQTNFFRRGKSPKTLVKHQELAAIFHQWCGREANKQAPRVVFDGFAGAGRFAAQHSCASASPTSSTAQPLSALASNRDSELGSPLLFYEWARRQGLAPPSRLVFAEKNPHNFSRLCSAFGEHLGQAVGATYASDAATIEIHAATFEHCATQLLAGLSVATKVNAVTLFSFVDPYTHDGWRLATICKLALRGALVLHLPSQAIYTSLISSNGAGPRQARKMEVFMGGSMPWVDLRREVSSLPPERARQLIAELFVQGLHQAINASGAPIARLCDIIALPDAESHLICL